MPNGVVWVLYRFGFVPKDVSTYAGTHCDDDDDDDAVTRASIVEVFSICIVIRIECIQAETA